MYITIIFRTLSHFLLTLVHKNLIDASEYCQELVYQISKLIESDLGMLPVPGKYSHS